MYINNDSQLLNELKYRGSHADLGILSIDCLVKIATPRFLRESTAF